MQHYHRVSYNQKDKTNPNLSPLRMRRNSKHQQQKERAFTLMGPEKNQRKAESCATHPEKPGEYLYSDEDEQFYYCCICAAKLASQGFQLQKLIHENSNHQEKMNRYGSETNLNPRKNSQDNMNFRRSRIKCSKYSRSSLIKEVDSLAQNVECLLRKYERLGQLDLESTEAEVEKEMVIKFYEKIMEIMEEYQEKHLRRLEQETGVNSVEIKDKIQTNLHELRTISEDMSSTDFDEVVENVSENQFKSCCQFYRSKYEQFQQQYDLLNHNVEKLGKARPHRHFSVSEIQTTIDKIEKSMKQFFEPNLPVPRKGPVYNFVRQFERENLQKYQKSHNNPKEYLSNRVVLEPEEREGRNSPF